MRTPSTVIGPLLLILTAGPAGADQSALQRLNAAIANAWRLAPQLEASRARLAGEEAGFRAEAAAGTPSVEWQREGIGPSFSHRDNAQMSVRLAAPFIPPWEWKKVAGLSSDAAASTDVGVRAAHHEIAAQVARIWLELAATLDELDVARGSLDRLAQAVTLQTRRRDLGEVAGLDVVQLELERLREANKVHRLETSVASARARLTELAGAETPSPFPGDLVFLVDLPSTLPRVEETHRAVTAGPLARAAVARAQLQEARAAVVAEAAWGRPEAEAEWERFPSLGGLPGYDALGLRLRWPLPIGGEGKTRTAAARGEAAAVRAAAEATVRELERRVQSAAAGVSGAMRVLDEAKPVMENLGRAEYSLAEQFRLGAISYIVYIDGLARLDEVRTQVIAARLDLLEARVELATVLGGSDVFPLPEVTP